MTNLEQFIQEFEDFYNGRPWYGSNFHEIVDDLSPAEALAVPGNGHSIARLLFHMIKWRKALTERLIGTPGFTASDTDPDNWVPLNTLNEQTWAEAKSEYHRQQERLLSELKKRDEAFLDEEWMPGRNYRKLICGVVQHDIYHLGQIAQLRSLLRSGKKQEK